ncbi:MAG: LamG-like jellyroll fold domain-containing protein, partial [Thermoguttaceae bacterium]|nr:LamG-like jellyroll fold domain-containing protein [Thermoguttaceae bacterium]
DALPICAEWLWHVAYNASAGTTDLNLSVWDATATAYDDHIRLTVPHELNVDDDFVHLAAARDGDRLALFVNGQEVASQLLAGFTALNDGTAGISIGTYIRNGASGGDALSGRIGEFNIWDIDTFQMGLGDFVANQYTLGFPLYVPEPSTSVLVLLGVLWLTASRRHRTFTRAALNRQGRQ